MMNLDPQIEMVRDYVSEKSERVTVITAESTMEESD